MDEIWFMKRLPVHRRAAILGFFLFAISGALVTSIFHLIGIYSTSETFTIFNGLLGGAAVWGLVLWFWGTKFLKYPPAPST